MKKIEDSVGSLDGVDSVIVNFASNTGTVEYDPEKVDGLTISKKISSLGYKVRGESIVVDIEGMHCANCAIGLEAALNETSGISSANVNFNTSRAFITYDPLAVDTEIINEVVRKRGV